MTPHQADTPDTPYGTEAGPPRLQPVRLGTDVSRRRVLQATAAVAASVCVPTVSANAMRMELAISQFTGTRAAATGGVMLDVPSLVENGNSVPVRIGVDSPMTEFNHVRRIALFTEKNPLPQVAVFHLGPRAGRAQVSTRIRLADSQRIVALAELSDGSFRREQVDVIVTLAACIET